MNIYSLAFLLFFQFAFVFPNPDSEQKSTNHKPVIANLVFKSADGGKSWQDISEGLPQNLEEGSFFANESGLYLGAGTEAYHNKPNSTAPFWTKEIFPGKWGSIVACKSGLLAYNYDGEILKKKNGTDIWKPLKANVHGVLSVFETAKGTIFITADRGRGLFKSTDGGKNWKHVNAGGLLGKVVETNDVLVATSMKGIIRSTDDGENWELVISEGGVGIDVARIEGGFAAITFNTQSNTRRIRTSYDAGKTWQPIDAGFPTQNFFFPVANPLSQPIQSDSAWNPNPVKNELPDQAFINTIVQVGEDFFCGHPKGIFKTSDKGKTWKLILPSIENKVFNLSVSNGVIYAIPRNRGC